MKLKIRSIHGHGKADEEYVILDALEECDVKNYMIADTTYTGDGGISNKVRHTHWFYPATLKAGDVLVLLTGNGTDSTNNKPEGYTVHYRHWGLGAPVWNDHGDGAILFELHDWNTTKVAGSK